MFRNSLITLAVTGSFFSSCKTVDLPVQEVQTPASSSWSAPTTNGKVPESRAWLTDFATPELTGLVNQALANNLNLQASAARIRAAQSIVIQRNALSLPRLGVGGEAARSDSRFSNPTSNFMIGPNVRWELDLWDRLSLQRDASSLDAEVLVNVDRGLRRAQRARPGFLLRPARPFTRGRPTRGDVVDVLRVPRVLVGLVGEEILDAPVVLFVGLDERFVVEARDT